MGYTQIVENYEWVSIDSLSEEKPDTTRRSNLWWVTNKSGEVCLYMGICPQANANPEIAAKCLDTVPGAVDLVFVPVAYA